MQEAFEQIGVGDGGDVGREAFLQALSSVGIDDVTANKLFDRFDPDKSGTLDREEFFAFAAKGCGEVRNLLRHCVLASGDETVDKIVDVFKAWDKDGDGTISRDELERVFIVLNPSFTKKDLDLVMKVADRNGDGVIDYEEFADWLQDKPPANRR